MNDLVPFGKYKNQPLEVMLADDQYVGWLTKQPWLKNYNIYNNVIQYQKEPTYTPEHNRMQIQFLDKDNVKDLVSLMVIQTPSLKDSTLTKFKVVFEEYDWDMIIGAVYSSEFTPEELEWVKKNKLANTCHVYDCYFGVELKPTVGDDYPDILRKMKRRAEPWQIQSKLGFREYIGETKSFEFLVLEQYTGSGASFEQMKALFKNEGIGVIRLDGVLS